MARSRSLVSGVLISTVALCTHACLFPDFAVVGEGGAGKGGGGGAKNVDGSTGGSATGAVSGSGGLDGGGGIGGDGGIGGVGGTNTGGSDPGGGAAGCSASCTLAEDCGNGTDDDGDLDVDCRDEDCLVDPECAGTCTPAEVLPCGATRQLQSTEGPGSTDRLGPPTYNCLSGTYEGSERAYLVSAEPGQNVFVEVYGLDSDVGLFLTDVIGGAACRADFACILGSDTASTAAELVTFTSQAGRDYYAIVDSASAASYAITVQCSPPTGCRAPRVIEAGQSIDANNAIGASNVTQVLTEYSCQGSIHLGPEAAYMFTPATDGSYRVDLTNLTGNLSLFVVSGECGTTCSTAASWSVKATTQPESVTIAAVAHQTYYVLLDSYNNTTINYTLSVTAL